MKFKMAYFHTNNAAWLYLIPVFFYYNKQINKWTTFTRFDFYWIQRGYMDGSLTASSAVSIRKGWSNMVNNTTRHCQDIEQVHTCHSHDGGTYEFKSSAIYTQPKKHTDTQHIQFKTQWESTVHCPVIGSNAEVVSGSRSAQYAVSLIWFTPLLFVWELLRVIRLDLLLWQKGIATTNDVILANYAHCT